MAYYKKLGIFLETPVTGMAHTGLAPPLSKERAAELSQAISRDLLARLERLKKTATTVFYHGEDIERLRSFVPERFALAEQAGAALGERLRCAFDLMMSDERDCAVIIGGNSPDLPLQYIKRAYLKLKHKDVVLGPCTGGGYYLIGLKSPAPALFEEIPAKGAGALRAILDRIEEQRLTLSLLPVWYRVDDVHGISLLKTMMRARMLEKSGRLLEIERVIAAIDSNGK